MSRINRLAPKLRKAALPPLSHAGAPADADRAKRPSLVQPSASGWQYGCPQTPVFGRRICEFVTSEIIYLQRLICDRFWAPPPKTLKSWLSPKPLSPDLCWKTWSRFRDRVTRIPRSEGVETFLRLLGSSTAEINPSPVLRIGQPVPS